MVFCSSQYFIIYIYSNNMFGSGCYFFGNCSKPGPYFNDSVIRSGIKGFDDVMQGDIRYEKVLAQAFLRSDIILYQQVFGSSI